MMLLNEVEITDVVREMATKDAPCEPAPRYKLSAKGVKDMYDDEDEWEQVKQSEANIN